MKRKNIIFIAVLATLLLIATGAYILIVRPRLAPSEEPATPPPSEEPAQVDDERHAVLNFYFHSPLPLAGISRMELTITGIDAIPEHGVAYAVMSDARRITVQQGISQKVTSSAIFHGGLRELVLHFGPTARIFMQDMTAQTVFLPQRELTVAIGEEVSLSRTLNVLIALPKGTSFDEQNGVVTLEMPRVADAERAILGGFFLNERSIGEIYDIPTATIRDVILADIGLDIAPRSGERGSGGFDLPKESAPSASP